MVTHPEDRCEKEPYVVSYSCCSPYLSSFIYLNSTTCLPHCSQRNSEEQFWSCHSSTENLSLAFCILRSAVQISWLGLWGPFDLAIAYLSIIFLFFSPNSFPFFIVHFIPYMVSHGFESFHMLVYLSGAPFHSLFNSIPSLEAN